MTTTRNRTILLAMLASLTLGGCITNEQAGGAAGAVIGGVIGSQFGRGTGQVAATAAGAVVGGLIGGAIGRDLDEQERRAAYEAQLAAVNSGRPERWSGRPGYGGYVEPGVATYRSEGYCREYYHTVSIEGRATRVSGLACRQPDGTWAIVS